MIGDLSGAIVSATSSAVVMFAVIVCLHDLGSVADRLHRKARVAYQWGVTLFLLLIALGEGANLFTIVFDGMTCPRAGEVLSRGGWLIAGLWVCIARPLSSAEIVCRHRAACPVMHPNGRRVKGGSGTHTILNLNRIENRE